MLVLGPGNLLWPPPVLTGGMENVNADVQSNKSLQLTEREAFALLQVAILASNEDDEAMAGAVRKIANYCRGFLTSEFLQRVPA